MGQLPPHRSHEAEANAASIIEAVNSYDRTRRLGGDPTLGARWREEGKPDPHGHRYDCDRAQLAGGDLTDDEVANAVFLNSSIYNLTAAKDRMRWLSRQLERATAVPVQAWHPNDNRNYEPVETRAKEIYDGFVYDGVGTKPKWTPHGNGMKQDEARALALAASYARLITRRSHRNDERRR